MDNKPKLVETRDGHNYLVPFVLITTLFFLWGFAHSILDVLNKHFQDSLQISKTDSALVQAMVYGSYFLMALPVGEIIRRKGYRAGVLTGLVLYGVGALMFIPGSYMQSFPFFLLSLFVIGSGLCCLETSANPYATVLGDMDAAERRINLAQSLNGLGWIFGPLVGGLFIFSDHPSERDIAIPYTIIGCVALLVAVVFTRVRLPEISLGEENDGKGTAGGGRLWNNKSFTLGLVALFFYVAAQTGVNSFFINYVTDLSRIDAQTASVWLSFGGMGLFLFGRIAGSWVMKFLRSDRLMVLCSLGATVAMVIVCLTGGIVGMCALFLCYLCESIMFPTIFALAIKKVGMQHTKRASSYLIMTIVGGAFAPVIMGYIADHSNIAWGFSVPLVCFLVILAYSMAYPKLSK
ncbi:MAG: sugar MFS transporter [Prevotella sp.]|nr:sugar MFS transporter [Prevotella sp.]MDD7045750.1 sugar MFS transporter [Prevotella sp.]MDY5547417.1 sugar MFS transporter [Prevotella sp.]